jgi:hypothetical protein
MPAPKQENISSWDVSRAMQDVAKTWNCRLQLVMSVPISGSAQKALDIRLAQMQMDEKKFWRDVGGISRPWPSNGYATLMALCLALVYEFDAGMQRKQEEAESGRKGQLALW